jgi:putative component of membrane protein insertase Oxa1/YidC/SpoIIIJ protein YidD
MPGRRVALASIGVYQRYISPYKGYCCAYRAHTGAHSCSTLALRAIRRHGLLRGLGILRWRLAECGNVYRQHHPRPRPFWHQRGSCDAPCDIPCDGPSFKCAGDAFSNCPCDCCDWGNDKSRQKHKQEQDNPGSSKV